MSDASFFARNKTVIAVSVLAGASAVGAYYYYSQLESETSASEPSKKKKPKKKKGGKDTEGSQNSTEKTSETSEKVKVPYPVDSKGFPNFTKETISKLTDDEKEEWALALKNAGNDRYKSENFEDAIVFYSASLDITKDPVFYSNRSACYSALGKHDKVIEDTTAAINIKRDYVKCYLRRASSYENLEKYAEAMFDLTALTILGGFNSKPIEQSLEAVLQKHSLKIVEENYKNRVPELPSASTIGAFFGTFEPETAISDDSDEASGNKFLQEAIININTNTNEGYEKADTLLNQAIEAYNVDSLTKDSEDARNATIALEYAAAFKFLKNLVNEASELVDKAIALKPRPRTYVMRALFNADKSSFAGALEDFKVAQELEPKNGDVYYHLGQLFYLAGEYDNAEENFTKAKEFNPDNLYAYIQLACIFYKKGDFEKSQKSFIEAKLKFPTSPEILNYYGEILADHGDIEEAIKQYDIASRLQEALDNFSVGAIPLINKASLLSRQGPEKLQAAGELLTKACELDPKSEIARLSLAQYNLQIDEPQRAAELFEEGCNLARSIDEKIQATCYAEATKMQIKIKADKLLGETLRNLLARV